MFIHATMTRNWRTIRFYPLLLAVTLIGIGTNVTYAGWLDKLKEKVSSSDVKEQLLSTDEVSNGLKEALRVGTETVVGNLGMDSMLWNVMTRSRLHQKLRLT